MNVTRCEKMAKEYFLLKDYSNIKTVIFKHYNICLLFVNIILTISQKHIGYFQLGMKNLYRFFVLHDHVKITRAESPAGKKLRSTAIRTEIALTVA